MSTVIEYGYLEPAVCCFLSSPTAAEDAVSTVKYLSCAKDYQDPKSVCLIEVRNIPFRVTLKCNSINGANDTPEYQYFYADKVAYETDGDPMSGYKLQVRGRYCLSRNKKTEQAIENVLSQELVCELFQQFLQKYTGELNKLDFQANNEGFSELGNPDFSSAKIRGRTNEYLRHYAPKWNLVEDRRF
ncbi:hypothetical protein [Parashewanella tropica]|uniref:hypothetical protein n=1 Tax=Parashewanella tropica TaxID=2547970 RepID=UPI0010595F68|nr:hypothetical protein [Parashewanella tropica]